LHWQPPQQQQQWQPSPFGQAPETSGKATAALVLGICGLVVCPIILSIIGLVLGYQARGEIRASGGRIGGEGQAKAGIILGWVGLALWAVVIAAFLALALVGAGIEDSIEYDQDFSLLIRP
jgi:hypothetical protein